MLNNSNEWQVTLLCVLIVIKKLLRPTNEMFPYDVGQKSYSEYSVCFFYTVNFKGFPRKQKQLLCLNFISVLFHSTYTIFPKFGFDLFIQIQSATRFKMLLKLCQFSETIRRHNY